MTNTQGGLVPTAVCLHYLRGVAQLRCCLHGHSAFLRGAEGETMPGKTPGALGRMGVPPLCFPPCNPASHLPYALGGMHVPRQWRCFPLLREHLMAFLSMFFRALHHQCVFSAGLALLVTHWEIFFLALSIVLEIRLS